MSASQKIKIIIGAGLGGLIHGILHKIARPKDKVIMYDGNRYGGFCTSFFKSSSYEGEKVTYTVNIPLITSDFEEGNPLALFLDYMGVKNLNWRVIENLFKYYPENENPFVLKNTDIENLVALAPTETEKKNVRNFFAMMSKFYNELMDKAKINPKPLDAIKCS